MYGVYLFYRKHQCGQFGKVFAVCFGANSDFKAPISSATFTERGIMSFKYMYYIGV